MDLEEIITQVLADPPKAGEDARTYNRRMAATPYHNSRLRVLTAYRRLREQGVIPAHAMYSITTRLHREMSQADMTSRYLAEKEWDLAHARRYAVGIERRGKTPDMHGRFWRSGTLTRAR